MSNFTQYLRHSLVSKLIIIVGLTVILSISAWAYFNINNIRTQIIKNLIASTDRLANSIKLGTHYAMMLNSRDDITQIINNIATQPEIENIRIYNKEGKIKFTNQEDEIDKMVDIKEVACDICHKQDPPPDQIGLQQRTRFFRSEKGHRLLGIVQPICNEPGCATECHFHPEHQQILGSLDVVVSLEQQDRQMSKIEKGIISLALSTILIISVILFFSILQFVKKPIIKLIEGTRKIAEGKYDEDIDIGNDYEIGLLGTAIKKMGAQIGLNQAELKKQKNEYQSLFDTAPCMITVQDKNYRLLRWNKVFKDRFDPKPGSCCYYAYKGLEEKCPDCPVEKTFLDGKSHYGEAEGMAKDGEKNHWIFITSPVTDTEGNVVAAMEMSIDITPRRRLEKELKRSEEKYHAIFNNISNPVFVVDIQTFAILDCNIKAVEVYGYSRSILLNKLFSEFFVESQAAELVKKMRSGREINKVKHLVQNNRFIYVDMWVSPSNYSGQKVLLVTINDITQRLETEQHLMHASKMATLGEMSTGIAHELNQPLSVIKSSSSFCMKKMRKNEIIEKEIFNKLISKIDSNVDRAEKIIHHMRQFARKTEIKLVRTNINKVLQRTFEMFNQQLKIHGIDVIWDKNDALPEIQANPDRLEQVFINLVMNAKDAIEEKWEKQGTRPGDTDKITIITKIRDNRVVIEIRDTGIGIQKEAADKLFEPFFTTKEVGKGTGLGLSISYGIIKECSGTIQAEPGKNKGAVFIISFPVPDGDGDDIVYESHKS
ncbi:ATP-binding protein [Desulfobacula toluolica]|uniref:histidine kinase n=1 Tax=Desulfobacula toluolica (strain DSM 7467 / Tol2) TaxID=651182 RepID=K0N7N0_DESTT|nr:ATP-binding protein [Desulfobacula toluolica]CCK79954.1 two component system sensor histidine kinase [Desulfobacula toluolica Tol2]